MKSIILTILLACSITSTFAQTNSVLEQVQTTVKTNINDVVVDILRGVKVAGGEIYDASKIAITKSVDFTVEQAPLVVKEFLHWKLAERFFSLGMWILVALIFFYLAYRLVNYFKIDKEAYDEFGGFEWSLRCIGIAILIINLGCNGPSIVKIIVAPRVYLIEYVVDTIQGNNLIVIKH